MKNFIRRPDPYPDESLKGYFLRLANENGVTIFDFNRELGVERYFHTKISLLTNPKFFLQSDIPTRLKKNINQLSKLTHQSISKGLNIDNENDYIINRLFNSKYIRVCPKCLQEKEYIRKHWDVNLVTCCTRHDCLLVDRCFKCRKKFTLNRFVTCQCGLEYKKQKIESVTHQDKQLSFILEKLIYDESVELVSKLDQVCFITLVLRLSGLISRMDLNRHLGHRVMTVEEQHEVFVKSFNIFVDWPYNFYRFLDDLYSNPKPQSEKKDGIIVRFGTFYKYFLNKYLSNQKFDFIREAFESYLLANWKEGLLGNNLVKKLSSEINSSIVSATKASKILKCDYKKLVLLVQTKVIEGIIYTSSNGNTWTYVRKEGLEQYQEEANKWITKTLAVKELGISTEAFNYLINKGYLSGSKTGNTWLVSLQSVQSILNSLEVGNHCERIEKGIKDISFSECLHYLKDHNLNGEIFLEAIRNRQLITRKMIQSKRKQIFYFHQEAFYNWIRENYNEVYYLFAHVRSLKFNSSLLRFESIGNRLYISLNKLNESNQKFVSLQELSKKYRQKPVYLKEQLFQKGIIPVSGPEIDGNRGYYYLRESIVDDQYLDLIRVLKLNTSID